jgi:cytochrome c556
LVVAAEPAAKKPEAVAAAKKPTLKQGLEAPSYLSPLARQLLKQRMKRHGTDMLTMVRSVLFLDHETTQRLASELAAEPRLTRAIAGGSDDLNAALPERFFVLQDELRSRALELSAAAREGDDAKLAARLGEVTQTCVSCHSTYLEPGTP